MGRAPCCEKVGLNRGPWTKEEDMLLTRFIVANGEGGWRHLPKAAGLLRCGKSCRLRWINYLRPGLKRGNITEEEDRIIMEMHYMLGNRWSLIAARLPGRTDNEIKNYWNTHLKKKKMKLVEKKQDQEQKPQLNLINTPLNQSSSAINKENINPIPSNPSLICPIKPCKSNNLNDNQMCFLARPLYSLDPNSLSTLPKLHDHHPNPSYLPKPSINCPGYPLTSTQDITAITPYNSVNCNSKVNIGANDGISGNDAIRVNNEGYIDEGFIFTVRNSSSSHLLLGPPANTNINTSTSTTATTRLMRAPSSASSSSSGISMERLRSTRSDISISRNNIRAIVSFLEMDTTNNPHTTISPIPTANTATTTTTTTTDTSSSTIDLADAFNDLVCEEKLSHHSPLFIQDSHIDHLAAADLEHLFITQDEVDESSTLLLGDDHGQAYCWDFTQQDDHHQILNSLKAHE